VNVAVSPGSTEVTFPGPPFVDVTVSVNGAPIVPVSVTLCGLPVAESTNCNTAVSSAVPNGVKIRFTTQELVGGVDGTVESPEQVVPLAMMVKSPGCGLLPVPAITETLSRVSGAEPVFVSVTDTTALGLLTPVLVNPKLVADSVTAGALTTRVTLNE